MLPDAETEAAAALVAAAFDGATPAQRRALWRALRATTTQVRGSTWRPGSPWSGVLDRLRQRVPRRMATRLGVQPGGTVNRDGQRGGHTVPAALPWAWATHDEGDDAA